MNTRVAVVTGANRGLGLAIVKELCKNFDGLVYLTGRSLEACVKKVAELAKDGCKLSCHQLDISDPKSIEKFANFIAQKHGGLDILINNAAIAYKMDAVEPFIEQTENTIFVNYFATLNVCKALFPLLRPYARVVNISSFVGMVNKIPSSEIRAKLLNANLTEDDLNQLMQGFVDAVKNNTHLDQDWGSSAYVISKVGLTALTFLQQKEFDKDSRSNIIVNAVNPGWLDTDMSSHKGLFSPDEGAQAPVYLALIPQSAREPRGQMVWNDKKVVKWTDDIA